MKITIDISEQAVVNLGVKYDRPVTGKGLRKALMDSVKAHERKVIELRDSIISHALDIARIRQ